MNSTESPGSSTGSLLSCIERHFTECPPRGDSGHLFDKDENGDECMYVQDDEGRWVKLTTPFEYGIWAHRNDPFLPWWLMVPCLVLVLLDCWFCR